MKKTISILILGLIFFVGNVFAQDSTAVKNHYRKGNANHIGFIDANGDGYNDYAADHDGDGIPNGMDEDYTGAKNRKGNNSKGFVDLDGNGINDNVMDSDGDGIPNGRDDDYVRPLDGSGSMRGAANGSGSGTGVCDGTGSQGNKRGGKR